MKAVHYHYHHHRSQHSLDLSDTSSSVPIYLRILLEFKMQFLTLLSLLPLALSAPTAPAVKKTSVATTTPFTLTSRTIGGNVAYNDLGVFPYHIDPAHNWVVLGGSGSSKPPTAVINGTINQLATIRGDVVFGFGSDGSLPYGWTVPSSFGDGAAVQINGGPGTAGIYLHDEGSSAGEEIYILKYDTPFFSGWYGEYLASLDLNEN
jgi:hypothetical protein